MIRVQTDDFDVGAELSKLTAGNREVGGVAVFVGLVRDIAGSAAVGAMTLEHYPGMTEKMLAKIEAEARERCRAVDIYKASFRPMKLTLTERDEKMLIKLVVDGESGVVLGCHLMGPDSGELIQVLGILVKMGATKAQFDATVAVHPSAAEELVTMREPTTRWAAEAAE